MTLSRIREKIDQIDPQMKELFLQRMEAAKCVAEIKYVSGDEVYKAERELEIIERLTRDIEPGLEKEYTLFIKRLMEIARMYEYGLIYEKNPDVMEALLQDVKESQDGQVKIQFQDEEQSGSALKVLSAIRDYGFQVEKVAFLEECSDEGRVEVSLCGNIEDIEMKKLLYQLLKETKEFKVL